MIMSEPYPPGGVETFEFDAVSRSTSVGGVVFNAPCRKVTVGDKSTQNFNGCAHVGGCNLSYLWGWVCFLP